MIFNFTLGSKDNVEHVFLLCDPDSENTDVFQVLVSSERWISLLDQYIANVQEVRDRKNKIKAHMLTFTFRSFYAAMLSYPPFANAVLNASCHSTSNLQNTYITYPGLSKYLHPISIKIDYE